MQNSCSNLEKFLSDAPIQSWKPEDQSIDSEESGLKFLATALILCINKAFRSKPTMEVNMLNVLD